MAKFMYDNIITRMGTWYLTSSPSITPGSWTGDINSAPYETVRRTSIGTNYNETMSYIWERGVGPGSTYNYNIYLTESGEDLDSIPSGELWNIYQTVMTDDSYFIPTNTINDLGLSISDYTTDYELVTYYIIHTPEEEIDYILSDKYQEGDVYLPNWTLNTGGVATNFSYVMLQQSILLLEDDNTPETISTDDLEILYNYYNSGDNQYEFDSGNIIISEDNPHMDTLAGWFYMDNRKALIYRYIEPEYPTILSPKIILPRPRIKRKIPKPLFKRGFKSTIII